MLMFNNIRKLLCVKMLIRMLIPEDRIVKDEHAATAETQHFGSLKAGLGGEPNSLCDVIHCCAMDCVQTGLTPQDRHGPSSSSSAQ